MIRNEEDAATAAIEAYLRANGTPDPRMMAKAVLAALTAFKAKGS